ncbi:SigE family RNA polymerase sigma factor [Nocardioides sp. NPDC057772]|uniref:SigE family RNA polymerase sigma factor n=1 Tax=Nocardioides sp. NPDC057772 TaxID=3346245 RepID=UPI00366EF089
MLTDLLEDLAHEAPTGGAPPGQLWRRGRRIARTRRVGTIAIAAFACLVLIALGSVTWQQRAVEPPAAETETKTHVPARIYRPSPYLPGTDDKGPPGVLIATIKTERKGWADRGCGLVGVSAATGDYRFLDLLDAHPEHLGDAALSPDGRHVAYWITGSVPDPLPERPKVPSSTALSDYPPIVGYAVYDTVAGKAERLVQSTQHGLDGRALVWFDPTHLGVEIGQMQDCCSSNDSQSLVFDLTSRRPTSIDVMLTNASTNAVGSLVAGSDNSVVVEADGSTTPAHIPQTAGRINGSQFVALSPDAKRTAAIYGNGVPGPVYVKASTPSQTASGSLARTWGGSAGWTRPISRPCSVTEKGPGSTDSDLFEEFVAGRRPALLRTAFLLTGHAEDAEDLVQTTLIKVVPRWARIKDNPEAYVRKVLAREAITRWRTRRWRETLVEHLPDREATGPDPTSGIALRDALLRLPPPQRTVIVLRYYDDLTERETAATLGVSIGTVKSQSSDALTRLRVLIPDLASSDRSSVAGLRG